MIDVRRSASREKIRAIRVPYEDPYDPRPVEESDQRYLLQGGVTLLLRA